MLLLCDYEDFFLREVKDLPLQKRPNCSPDIAAQLQPRIAAALSRLPDATFGAAYQVLFSSSVFFFFGVFSLPTPFFIILRVIASVLGAGNLGLKAVTCGTDSGVVRRGQAWMGFYNSSLRKLGWSKEDLVHFGNTWITQVCGRSEIPALEAKTVGKMGLKGVPGPLNDELRLELALRECVLACWCVFAWAWVCEVLRDVGWHPETVCEWMLRWLCVERERIRLRMSLSRCRAPLIPCVPYALAVPLTVDFPFRSRHWWP